MGMTKVKLRKKGFAPRRVGDFYFLQSGQGLPDPHLNSFYLQVTHSTKLKRQFLNQLINLFWTILAFAPVMAFWLAVGSNLFLFLLLTLSISTLYLPERFYQLIQVSDRIGFYEKWQLKIFRRYTQDGDMVRQIISGKNPSAHIRGRADAARYMNKIRIYERFHLIGLAFFLLTTIYAIILTNFAIALMITLANIVYNIIPLLLQQYNRLRVKKLLEE